MTASRRRRSARPCSIPPRNCRPRSSSCAMSRRPSSSISCAAPSGSPNSYVKRIKAAKTFHVFRIGFRVERHYFVPMMISALLWSVESLACELLRLIYPKRVITVHYEDLCAAAGRAAGTAGDLHRPLARRREGRGRRAAGHATRARLVGQSPDARRADRLLAQAGIDAPSDPVRQGDRRLVHLSHGDRPRARDCASRMPASPRASTSATASHSSARAATGAGPGSPSAAAAGPAGRS